MAPHATLRTRLLRWYRRTARDLPWRRTSDPYHVWVSEIMLQQTQTRTVEPYYARFLELFPTVESLAAAPLERVLKTWQGLGYYSRARNLHAAARLVVRRLGGALPASAAAWQELPGVGRYTAAAIASITRGEPAAALDGNMRRVLARLFAVDAPVDQPATQNKLWQLAEMLLDRRFPGDFNQAMMDLGARVCKARAPICGECPLVAECAAFRAGLQAHLPRRRIRRDVPRVTAVAAAVERAGRYLLVRRPARGMLGGLWCLPMLDSPRENAAAALREHVLRKTGLRIAVGQECGRVTHVFTHRRLTLYVYRCRVVRTPRARAGSPSASRRRGGAWLRPVEFESRPVSELDRKALALLASPQERHQPS